jgi:hypothetical protein
MGLKIMGSGIDVHQMRCRLNGNDVRVTIKKLTTDTV